MQDHQDIEGYLANIKAGFVKQKTSLNRFCLNNGIDPSNAVKALKGEWQGEKANEVCELIINAANIGG